MNDVIFYRCEKCGNIVVLIQAGGGTLTCCGQSMTKLQANSTDAAKEKHVPVATSDNGKIKVSVGSVAHPMLEEHYIQWIALVTENKVEITYLKPEIEPITEFVYINEENEVIYTGAADEIVPNCEGSPCNFVYTEKEIKETTIYAYCNLHGLWSVKL